MSKFRSFYEQHEFASRVINEFDQGGDAIPEKQSSNEKVWSAKKDDIIRMWKQLRPDVPIMITPMDKDGGDSYGEDGIRVTGTWNFIASVLGRLKDVLSRENPQTKLRLVFRGVEARNDARPDRNSFVFYLNLERRGTGKPGRPKKPSLPTL